MNKLKIGLIIDSTDVNIYKKNLVEYIVNNNQYFDRPVLISQNFDNSKPQFNIKKFLKLIFYQLILKLIEKVIYKLINFLEIRTVRKNKLHSNYGKFFDLNEFNLKLIKVYPTVSKSGYFYRFLDSDLDKIKNLNLDVLIRCGSGIHKGQILSITKFGILSFHHGDNRVNRGSVSGFWETFFDWPSTGFIIQRLNEELDGGDVICRGNITTSPLWHENNAQLLLKSNYFMFQTLKYLYENRSLPPIEPSVSYSNKIFKKPNTFHLIKYLLKEYPKIIKSKIHFFLNIKKKWSVSFINQSGLKININKSILIKNPPNRFLADPFIIKHNNKNICFVEDFYFKEDKGKISAFELSGNSYKEIGIAIEENFHMSFPYVFKNNNNIYMIPETSEHKEIRLYKCEEFPLKWKLEKVLMNNIVAVDTVVFNQKNKWHMLTNICSSSIGEHLSELHMFEADNLVTDIWKQSKNNPIIFDSEKARNGGLFCINNIFYRVNQSQNKDTYGYSFKINKIKSINKDFYIEEEICHIKPNFFKSIIATHHLHMNDDYTVFDHCSFSK